MHLHMFIYQVECKVTMLYILLETLNLNSRIEEGLEIDRTLKNC